MSQGYQVEFTKKANKALEKMDRFNKELIISWIERKLEGCVDPRIFGKGLTGNMSERWRYRVGNYRILAKIYDQKVLIHIIDIGHRDKIYTR